MTQFPLQRIEIRLDIGEQRTLHIMLGASGAINRMGDGSGKKLPLTMGHTDTDLFAEVEASIPADWWDMVGRYTMPDPKGKVCQLEIGLAGDKMETGIAFTFGSQSEGPPSDIMNWIDEVLGATEPWYQDQQQRKQKRR